MIPQWIYLAIFLIKEAPGIYRALKKLWDDEDDPSKFIKEACDTLKCPEKRQALVIHK